jgi:hypothetical protein
VCFPEEKIGAEEAETMENKVELGEVVGFIGIISWEKYNSKT